MQILLSLFLIGGLGTNLDIQYFQVPGSYSGSSYVSGWFASSGNDKISLYPVTLEAAQVLSQGLDTKNTYSCDAKAYRAPESSSVGVFQSQGQLNRYVYLVYELRCQASDK